MSIARKTVYAPWIRILALGAVSMICGGVVLADAPPAACFRVNPVISPSTNPFNVDAGCSTDDVTSPSALEVQWDWENDGIWDTAFSTNKRASHVFPSDGSYTIAVGVRDGAANTSIATRGVTVGGALIVTEAFVTSAASEVYLDLDPSDPERIVLSANAKRPFLSVNGGAFWSTTTSSEPGSDPGIAFDADGRVFYSRMNGPSGNTDVWRSTDGGASFPTVSNPGHPMSIVLPSGALAGFCLPWLPDQPISGADDGANSPFRNHVYLRAMASTPVNGECRRLNVFWHSADGGDTWTGDAMGGSDDPSTWDAAFERNLVIGPDGVIRLFGHEYGVQPACFQTGIAFLTSTDGGATFTPGCIPTGQVGYHGYGVTGTVDPEDPNKVWAVRAVGFNQGYRLFVFRSTDGGVSWSTGVRVDDTGSLQVDRDQIEMVATRSGGQTRVHLAWVDLRNSPSKLRVSGSVQAADVYYSYSDDGGVTWAPNVRITSPPTAPYYMGASGNDYMGLVGSGAKVRVGYGLNRTANPDWEAYVTTIAPASPAIPPYAPEELVASDDPVSIALTWAPPASNGGSGLTGYKVYRGVAGSNLTFLTTTGTSPSFTDVNVVPGATYTYQISAVSAAGEGVRSNADNATVTTPPGAPTGLAATANAVVSLSWLPPANDGGSALTGFNIYRGLTSTGKTLLATTGTTPSYADTEVTPGTTYYYDVTALNAIGESSHSGEVTARPPTVPTAPTALSAIGGPHRVDLAWTTPADDGGQPLVWNHIFRRRQSESFSLLDYAAGTATTYTDDGSAGLLIVGETYYYQVVANNGLGLSPPSNEASAAPTPGAPSSPTNLSATGGPFRTDLAWTAPADNGGAPVVWNHIFRRRQSESFSLLDYAAGAATTYTDDGSAGLLIVGETYYYQVVANNAWGLSSPSNEASAVPAGTPPTEPRNLSEITGNLSVTLTWDLPLSTGGAPVTTYGVYRSPDPVNFAPVASGGCAGAVANLTCTDGTAANNVKYYYRVTAMNPAGEGPPSNVVTLTPSQPATLNAQHNGPPNSGRIKLTWTAPVNNGGSAVTNYKVFQSTDSVNFSPVTAGGCQSLGNVTTCTRTGLSQGVTYHFKVSAVNAVGEGPKSATASAGG